MMVLKIYFDNRLKATSGIISSKNNKLIIMNIKLEKIDYAFQPIVNIYTGVTVAFEAIIRNVEDLEKFGVTK